MYIVRTNTEHESYYHSLGINYKNYAENYSNELLVIVGTVMVHSSRDTSHVRGHIKPRRADVHSSISYSVAVITWIKISVLFDLKSVPTINITFSYCQQY